MITKLGDKLYPPKGKDYFLDVHEDEASTIHLANKTKTTPNWPRKSLTNVPWA